MARTERNNLTFQQRAPAEGHGTFSLRPSARRVVCLAGSFNSITPAYATPAGGSFSVGEFALPLQKQRRGLPVTQTRKVVDGGRTVCAKGSRELCSLSSTAVRAAYRQSLETNDNSMVTSAFREKKKASLRALLPARQRSREPYLFYFFAPNRARCYSDRLIVFKNYANPRKLTVTAEGRRRL